MGKEELFPNCSGAVLATEASLLQRRIKSRIMLARPTFMQQKDIFDKLAFQMGNNQESRSQHDTIRAMCNTTVYGHSLSSSSSNLITLVTAVKDKDHTK